MFDKRHYSRIDFLRGIAILYVVLYHYQAVLFPGYSLSEYSHSGTLNVPGIKSMILNFSPSAFGYTGVTLFLIISGFLIHLGYLKNKETMNISTFYGKRFWRIFPPYWVAIFIFILYFNFHNLFGINLKDVLLHILTLHNLSEHAFFSINPSFWSLALEVQLYLIYPVFLYVRSKAGINLALTGTVVLSVILVITGIAKESLVHSVVYSNSVFHFWFVWAAGAYLAELYYNKKRIFAKGGLTIATFSFLLLIAGKYFFYTHYFYQQFATFAWIVFFDWFLNNESIELKSKVSKWVVKIGLYSYSIYLFHQPILTLLYEAYVSRIRAPFIYSIIIFVPIFAIILIISYISYKYIELPSIAFGSKLRSMNAPKELL